jgi:uncharacterized protein (TIGR00304 family)
MDGKALILGGMTLMLIGFLMVFIGMIVSALGGEGDVEGGGVIMIGPIPIVFGTSRGAAGMAMVLAIILMALWVIAALLSRGD